MFHIYIMQYSIIEKKDKEETVYDVIKLSNKIVIDIKKINSTPKITSLSILFFFQTSHHTFFLQKLSFLFGLT